ncbi:MULTISPECIES: 4Fe-4S binding protein [unclassified Adlercreutzia]|uniref:4Fe-4S binding protein n=1 Tax=unclassified Adlercreutzia TaxID=2636013 RepID=UPI0013E9E651|nr:MULTISPECIES: 4Fe-4S binding protein [unclassified Adlercreutzia]
MGGFKLGKMTLGSLFKKPETVMYPLETKPVPKGLKGCVENNVSACILCGICAKRCPCGAIVVDKKARTWTIDRFRCVQCGTCVAECPKSCLEMNPTRPKVAKEKSLVELHVPEPIAEPLQNPNG